MAFSDLCKISNAYKAVENEPDQSDRIMEENSMVRDLITKILDETGPTETISSSKPPDKALSIGLPTTQYQKSSITSYAPPSSFNTYQETASSSSLYNFSQNEQNGFSYNLNQNGFGNNNFVNYPESDVTALLGIEPVGDSEVTPEQLNLLRLAAQEIGGAQFTSPNSKYEDKCYNFFEPNQRSSLPETNMFSNNFNRPNSLNLDNFNSLLDSSAYNSNLQRYPNKYTEAFMKEPQTPNQESTELLGYLNQLSLDRPREEMLVQNNMDYKMPMEMNGHFNNDEYKMADDRSKMFNYRGFQQQLPQNKQFNNDNFFVSDVMKNDKSFQMNQNYDYNNQMPSFKPNGYQQDFMGRRDMNQMIPRENFQNGPLNEQRNFENGLARDNMQQAAMMRQNQELARQMNMIMRNRPPANQLNVDVSFLHENAQFNLGLGTMLGPSPPIPPSACSVMPSPMLDLPLLAPFYAMRNMRSAQTSSAILHARLDACYEQWRQLERERKRTEARLALAYPGRAVSSSNSIPVPRLPPCPTRVDRLTVDMLREHTKVLTLMGKMETLRASVCVAQNKKPNKPEENKITVLKRGQENVANDKDKEASGVDPANFEPASWKEDVKNLAEIAPHAEVEAAMLAWRSAVGGVQAARRRELARPDRPPRPDPILSLAEAVKQLAACARRARCAMWCDLTLTVALAPPPAPMHHMPEHSDKQFTSQSPSSNKGSQENALTHTNGNTANDTKEGKATPETAKADKAEPNNNNNNTTNNNSKTTKPNEKQDQKRRTQNYRHKLNQGRNDFYQKNQRYDNRFMHNRHPYYLATGPIN